MFDVTKLHRNTQTNVDNTIYSTKCRKLKVIEE